MLRMILESYFSIVSQWLNIESDPIRKDNKYVEQRHKIHEISNCSYIH